MEESNIPVINKSQNNPTSRKAVDFCIGFFGIIFFIFIVGRILLYLPIYTPFIPLVLAPIIVLIFLIHFFKRRRWIFWGMITSLIIGGGIFAYFLSQIRFG